MVRQAEYNELTGKLEIIYKEMGEEDIKRAREEFVKNDPYINERFDQIKEMLSSYNSLGIGNEKVNNELRNIIVEGSSYSKNEHNLSLNKDKVIIQKAVANNETNNNHLIIGAIILIVIYLIIIN